MNLSSAQRGPDLGLIFNVGALLTVVFVLLLNAVPVASNDLWLQIKVGQLTLDNGAIPHTVLFPFTAARDFAFNAHEWLPSVLFFECVRAFGPGSFMFLQALFALVQFALAFLLAHTLSRSRGVALVMAALAMLVANYRYVLRPELFALLFLVLLLLVLTRYRLSRQTRTLFWTIPIGVLWANCHGSFLLGPVVAGVFAVGETIQAAFDRRDATPDENRRPVWRSGLPYAVVAVGMLMVSMINPRGPELLAFAFKVQGSEAMKSVIKEWLPTFHPLFMITSGFWIFCIVGALSLGLIVVRWRSLTATEAMLFLLFAGLAMQRNRHIVWFAFIALTVCASLVGRRASTAKFEGLVRITSVVLALIGIWVCASFGNARGDFIYASPSNDFTQAMVQELSDPGLSGNVYNTYELGSELIYRDWPRLKPSIDSRIDSYGDAYFLGHQRLLDDEPQLMAFLSMYGVNHMLLLRRDFDGHVRAMPHIAAQWHIRLADFKMVLLERNVAIPLPAVPAP